MKFFLDTANTDDIRKYAELGLVDGVTTNPTIVAREGRDFESVIKEITTIVDGPVSAEVTANEADKMIEQARALAKWADNIVVKIPMTEAAKYMQTSVYEGSCMINDWVPRVLVKDGKFLEIDERK